MKDEVSRKLRQEMNDYENLLVGGKHSRKEIDEARVRLALKKKRRLKQRISNTERKVNDLLGDIF